jgi:hypothetical protein
MLPLKRVVCTLPHNPPQLRVLWVRALRGPGGVAAVDAVQAGHTLWRDLAAEGKDVIQRRVRMA